MKNRTVRVIVILVGLLVLNIEAAHAGITHKVKAFINHELSDFQLMYVSFGLLSAGFLGYVIFMPAFKDKSRNNGNTTYFQNYSFHTFYHKKKRIKKISQILKNAELSE
jgi:hypothetical protein